VRLGFALAFQPSLGADALWWSFPLGSVANFVMAVGYYRFGGWRKQRLVVPEGEANEQSQNPAEPGGRLHPAG
jgi:hypothetical protein